MATKKATKKVAKKATKKATRKTVKKAVKKVVARGTDTQKQAVKQADLFIGEYAYGVGRRKSSVAQVRLYKREENANAQHIVNTKTVNEFFPQPRQQKKFFAPLVVTGMEDAFVVSVVVRGGGATGQVEAARHGIARALVAFDENLRQVLKAERLLRRDPRSVERKKPGLKKARRATQWRKR